MGKLTIIKNVKGYIKDETVFLNLEDVARGLGWTRDNGKYIRWERVNKYLGRSRTQFNSFVSQEDLKKLIQSTNRVVDAKWYELAGLSANFVILTKEQETIGFLVDCFKFTEIKLQYYVAGKYKIDMYLPQFNIAIECDEFNHENRNIVDEVGLIQILVILKFKM